MNTLNAVITLLEAAELPGELAYGQGKDDGSIRSLDGKLYMLLNGHAFSCEDTLEGRAVLEAICSGLTGGRKRFESRTREECWRNCLLFMNADAIRELKERYREKDSEERRVILFQSRQEGELLRMHALAELVPRDDTEPLFAISGSEIAYIRNVGNQTADDVIEYAQAVVEFAESEMGLSLLVGIGGTQNDLSGLCESYQDAAKALQLGRQFHLTERVHVYQKQILERLLAAVPEAERIQVRNQVFNEKTQKLLNDEMRETIRVFFDNDLNLSTTARQLYLHRNTLTYRLDRIRRETGLDLRSFKDASAFKAIMECPGEDFSGTAKGGV